MSRRPNTKQALRLEALESRQLLNAGGPSAEAEYMLYLLNQVRTNPQAAAVKFTTNLDPNVQATVNYFNVDLNAVRNAIASSTPRQPLAWNDSLAAAAQWQSQDQANTGVQSHTGSDGSTSAQRIARNGYQNVTSQGENAYAYSQSVDHAMEAFLIDWGVASNGHRNNILQPNATAQTSYAEVGIGIVNTNKNGLGPEVITQDFASRSNYQNQLLGVAYLDYNNDGSFSQGEGQGNLQIDATNLATGQVTSVQTWNNGGYQLPLSPGQYKVVAHMGNRIFSTTNITMGSQNQELDFNLSQPWASDSMPAPTPTPVAQPVLAQQQIQQQAPVTPPVVVVPTQQTVASNNFAQVNTVPAQKSTTSWFSWSSWLNRS